MKAFLDQMHTRPSNLDFGRFESFGLVLRIPEYKGYLAGTQCKMFYLCWLADIFLRKCSILQIPDHRNFLEDRYCSYFEPSCDNALFIFGQLIMDTI